MQPRLSLGFAASVSQPHSRPQLRRCTYLPSYLSSHHVLSRDAAPALLLRQPSKTCLMHVKIRARSLNWHGESEVRHAVGIPLESVDEITADSTWRELKVGIDHQKLAKKDHIDALISAEFDILIM